MEIGLPKPAHAAAIVQMAETALGADRARRFISAHLQDHYVLVATEKDEVAGFIAYQTDWFQCTFVSLVVVTVDQRRRGIARTLFRAVQEASPSPRLFSSTEETNAVSIRMHAALGFTPSGYIDNLPQGYRELLFYKRIR